MVREGSTAAGTHVGCEVPWYSGADEGADDRRQPTYQLRGADQAQGGERAAEGEVLEQAAEGHRAVDRVADDVELLAGVGAVADLHGAVDVHVGRGGVAEDRASDLLGRTGEPLAAAGIVAGLERLEQPAGDQPLRQVALHRTLGGARLAARAAPGPAIDRAGH